jgi:tRNA threonylcarbamoyladenosine biosynthesis protein TsaB
MPRGLAIETSGRTGSIAIVENGTVLAEDHFPHGLRHAAEMIPRIDQLCRAAGWAPSDLRELYVSAGPGSFTGLRIGITLAKTLAFATGAKIVAVPSVRVLAENAPAEAEHLIIVLDAKRGQIFTARLQRTPPGWSEREPAHLDDLPSMLSRAHRPVWLLGEGIPYHQSMIPANDAAIHIASPDLWSGRAAAVARLGVQAAAEGRFTDPDQVLPIYLRKPEAEEKWEKRQT